mmetsp:Transcript_1104/g.988  ORF Transcript_1104/g.988 Transcript_1104/m.988 type:complete len:115 (+) Transcript_1104:2-346(+)
MNQERKRDSIYSDLRRESRFDIHGRHGSMTARHPNISSTILEESRYLYQPRNYNYNIEERLKGIESKLENANQRHLESLVNKQVVSKVNNDSRKTGLKLPTHAKEKQALQSILK